MTMGLKEFFGQTNIEKFKDQHYGALHKKCVGSKELFEDPLFTANEHSLNLTKPLGGTVVWKRPPVRKNTLNISHHTETQPQRFDYIIDSFPNLK